MQSSFWGTTGASSCHLIEPEAGAGGSADALPGLRGRREAACRRGADVPDCVVFETTDADAGARPLEADGAGHVLSGSRNGRSILAGVRPICDD